MAPKDFFIGVRQLLGVLLPGAIWLLSLVLILAKPQSVTLRRETNLAEIAVYLFGSYLFGYAIRRLTFAGGLRLGGWLLRLTRRWARLSQILEGRVPVPGASPDTVRIWSNPVTPEVINVLSKCARSEFARLRKAEPPNDCRARDFDTFYKQFAPTIAKYHVLGQGAMARRLEESEGEINLYATTSFPLIVFALPLSVWGVRAGLGSADYCRVAVIAVVCALVGLIFAWRAALRREGESRDIYLMFLTHTTFGAASGKAADEEKG
jgi:hypothetical protein